MTLQLLELDQADQLSACKLSLLLGIFEPHNRWNPVYVLLDVF